MSRWGVRLTPEERKANKKRYEQERAAGKDGPRKPGGPRSLLRGCRRRAMKKGMECSITADDVAIPEYCPVFGLKLVRHPSPGTRVDSPSVDRIDNSLGYVKGNVVVISGLANRLKGAATLGQLRAIVKFYDNLGSRDAKEISHATSN